MQKTWTWLAVLLLVLGAAGCSKEAKAPRVAGSKASGGAMLAYTHSVSIRMSAEAIGARVSAVRDACTGGKFGACNLIDVRQRDGMGHLEVRIVPEGVQGMIDLAAQGGRVTEHETQAEDIGPAVEQTQRDRAQLEQYTHRLDELAARKDLPASDLIALAHEQAEVAVKRQALDDTAAGQQRRLDTNLLTLGFSDSSRASYGGDAMETWDSIVDRTIEGFFDAVGLLGYGVPFLVIAFPLALFWRWGWRKATRKRVEPLV